MTSRCVVISGCSGGGKSTLLAALKVRGHAVVEEPGRRIVAEEQANDGTALPWVDLAAFLRRAIDVALADKITAEEAKAAGGWVFFDRGLVDAASGLEVLTGEAVLDPLCMTHRYHRQVFMAPPWPEIYTTDAERKHGFDAAVSESNRLMRAYPALGYETLILPKTSTAERADFVLARLAEASALS